MSHDIIDAIKSHDTRFVEAWINDPNATLTSKDPLVEACKRGYVVIAQLLLDSPKINPNAKGGKAYLFAARKNSRNIMDAFTQCKRFNPTFINSVIKKDFGWRSLDRPLPSNFTCIRCEADVLPLKQDIEAHIAKTGTEFVRVGLDFVFDVGIFVKHGFVPSGIINYNILEDYIAYEHHPHRYKILDLWHNIGNATTHDMFQDLSIHSFWTFRPPVYVQKMALEECCSFGLEASFLYTKSKRPKTDMSMFKRDDSKTYHEKDIFCEEGGKGIINVDNTLFAFFRVTRYAKGMSRGMYYGKSLPFCGTFYYLEEESDTLLLADAKTIATYPNKYHAVLNWNPIYAKQTLCRSVQPFLLQPQPLIFTPTQVKEFVERELDISGIPDTPKYAAKALGLYAAEDVFDQYIYKTGRLNKKEVVYFTNMVGYRNGKVGEVFDLRPRDTSFSMLAFKI